MSDYITTDGSDCYHASEDCPAFQAGRAGNVAQGIGPSANSSSNSARRAW
ncbi:hypothetical protein AB0P05_41815 [Streptomyces flaveolus]